MLPLLTCYALALWMAVSACMPRAACNTPAACGMPCAGPRGRQPLLSHAPLATVMLHILVDYLATALDMPCIMCML